MESQDFHQKSSYRVPILILLEISSAILYFKFSDKFILSFSFLPAVGFYLYFIYIFGWSGDWRQVSRRFFFTLIGIFIFSPIFFSIYFLVWNPTLSIDWFKSYSCIVQGQYVTQLGNLERYGVQYVQIGQDMIGMGCISNHKTNSNLMKGYDFYQRGDQYTCDNNFNQTERHHTSYKNVDQYKRILQLDSQYQYQQNQQQKNNSQYNSTHVNNLSAYEEKNKSDNQNQTQKKTNFTKRCRIDYKFTKVKIPSWLCQSTEDNYDMIVEDEEFINTEQICYYTYYGDREQARLNGRTKNINLKEQLDSEVYFFQEGFICLIIFAMYPAFIFSFQAPFSEIVYRLMVCFYQQMIKEENEIFKQNTVQEQPNTSKKQEQDEVGSTTQTERQKQQIQPHQIMQILSPNSQLKDRDFYNIYQGTRRKQPISCNNATTTNNTEEPINISKFNGDTTKSIMIKKDKQKVCAKSIDDIYDLNGEIINGPRNGSTSKYIEQETSSDEDNNGQDSSYIKIRNIYKKKLDPKYQKETKEKLQQGIKIENEEVKVIQEIKQKQQEYSSKQNKPKIKSNNQVSNQTYGEENPTIDDNKFQNDFNQLDDTNTEQIDNEIKQDEKEQPSKEQQTNQTQRNKETNNSNIEKQKEDNDSIQNDLKQIQKDEKEQDDMVKKLQDAYDIYSDQVDNKDNKEINTPRQEQQLIQ